MNELEHLQNAIAEAASYWSEQLLAGSPKDFAEYRHLVGRIDGLGEAERIIADMLEKLQSA